MPKTPNDKAQRIKDLLGDLGNGRVISVYTSFDSGKPEEVLVCEFGRGENAIHADRSAHEVEQI